MTVQTPVLVISLKFCDSYVTLSHVSTWMGDRLGIHGVVDILHFLNMDRDLRLDHQKFLTPFFFTEIPLF